MPHASLVFGRETVGLPPALLEANPDRLVKIPDGVTDPTQGLVIVIETAGRRCALLADELLGQQQVVIKPLGESLRHIPGVAGGAILGDGRVGIILDAAGVWGLATGAQQGKSAA